MYLDENITLEVIKAKQLEDGDIIIISAPKDSKLHSKHNSEMLTKFFSKYGARVLISYPEIIFNIVKG